MAKMTMNQAYLAHFKKHGKRATVQDLGKRLGNSSPEKRAAASRALEQHRKEIPTLLRIEDFDQNATVATWRACAAARADRVKEWRKAEQRYQSEARYYRYSVGHEVGGMFNCIDGQGDTWEEALTKAGAI